MRKIPKAKIQPGAFASDITNQISETKFPSTGGERDNPGNMSPTSIIVNIKTQKYILAIAKISTTSLIKVKP